MKICSRCNTSVSDEYRYCLNCGTVVESSSERPQEPLPTLVYQGTVASSETVPPTIPTAPAPNNPVSATDTSSGRSSRLPWLIVVGCITVILVLVAVIAIQKRSAVTETVATDQSDESAPTPSSSSETASIPSTNQPSPFTSVSPQEKKQPTATPTPVSGVVDNPQLRPSATPAPSVANTPTPIPTPTRQPTADNNRIYSNREVSERATIVSQPKPNYTEEARKNQVQGVVVLRVVLRFDGTIGNISVVSGLADGLTERAIAAARNIRFTPAQKDGVPVSVSVQVEYRFNLY